MPPSAFCSLPTLSSLAPVKLPLPMAEQLALDQLLGNGGAVDVDERLVARVAHGVDGVGDQFLARAALAEDQHAAVGAGHQAQLLAQRLDRDAVPMMPATRPRPRCAAAATSAPAAAARWRSSTTTMTLSMVSGFSRKSKAPSLVAFTAVSIVAVPGDHRRRRAGPRKIAPRILCQRLQTHPCRAARCRAARGRRVPPQFVDARLAAVDGGTCVALVLQHAAERLADQRFVVDNQNAVLLHELCSAGLVDGRLRHRLSRHSGHLDDEPRSGRACCPPPGSVPP